MALRAIAYEADQWSSNPEAPENGKYKRNSKFIGRQAMAIIDREPAFSSIAHLKAPISPDRTERSLGTPKRRREVNVRSSTPLGKEGSVWDPTESGSTAPISHKRASFPPPLVIRSFHSSVLRPKRQKNASRRLSNESAPTRTAVDLENKVGSLSLQVCEMMGLMKTLVSRKLKSDDKEEGTEDGRTSASPLLDIKGES